MKKAQIEFVAILGVIILLVIVAFYALQTSQPAASPVPWGVGAEQSMVKDKIEGIIRDGALLSVKWMESQGGSILPVFDNSVSFTRVMVPYWQKCDKSYVPSLDLLTRQLENATYNYVAYNLYNQTEIVLGKNVTVSLNDAKVTANILDNKIELMVSMPTSVQGYPIQQPYSVSVPTKFGEIYKFMKSYAEDAAKNRYIELFMINSIYFSNTRDEGGNMHAELPTIGALTECGETIDRSSEEISRTMEQLIEYTLTHVQWWVPAPVDPSAPKIYAIENLKGRTYPQLNPLFMVDDNFGINIGQGLHLTNPKPLATASALFGFTTSGLCVGTYSISYAFRTPVILKVHDTLTNNPFNIATLVDINDLMPGDCGEIPGQQYCEYNPGNMTCTGGGSPPSSECGCEARTTVTLADGTPAKGALVSFGGCAIKADSHGIVEGMVSCDAGDLSVTYSKSGATPTIYQRRSCGVSSSMLNGTITLYQYPKLNLHFREVNVTSCKANATENFVLVNVTSSEGCTDYITNINMTAGASCTNSATCSEELSKNKPVENAELEMQPGSYAISADMLSLNGTDGREVGIISSSFAVRQSSSDVFVYVPLYTNASLASYDYAMNMMQAMISNCSINPVMEVDKA